MFGAGAGREALLLELAYELEEARCRSPSPDPTALTGS